MGIDRTAASGIAFARRVYGPRALGCAFSFLYVASVTYPGSWPLWGLMLLNGFIWPCIAYQIALRSTSAFRAELNNMRFDCLFAGGWVVAMQFSVLPSLLLISMVAMNCVVAKGLRFMCEGLLMSALGVLVAGAVMGLEVVTHTPERVIWACLPMMVVYPLVVGWTSHKLARQLFAQQKAFSIVASFDEHPLINQSRWLYALAREFHRCRCGTSRATLTCIRIDGFGVLHERYGELVVEALSIRLGYLIQCEVRSADLFSRRCLGEYWVLFRQARTGGAQALAGRIEVAFNQFCAAAVPEARIRVGLAEFSQQLSSEHEWQRQAEANSFARSITDPREGPAGCVPAAS